MKHTRKLAAALAGLMLASLLSACGGQTDAPAQGQEDTGITVTDMSGREITLTAPVERVVALTAGDCEILYAIGAGDTLVGRGTYCDYPAQVEEIPTVQSGYETNIEQIVALKPQVVFTSTMAQSEEQISALEAAGITVVTSDADDIAGTYTAVELLGTVMGREEEAAAVIDEMKAELEALRRDIPEEERKSVYFEISPLEYGLWAAGENTFMDEICQLLGLKNLFADVDGWGQVSQEQVIQRDPDYIVTITMYFGEGPTPEEEICARTGWEDITAVKNGAILNLRNDELSRPAPRLAEGARLLSEFVYGTAE